MLKNLKKCRLFIVFGLFFIMIFTNSSNSYARFGRGKGSSGIGQIIKILIAMQTQQALMANTQIQQYLTEMKQLQEEIKQLETQTKMWENQMINLRQIGEDFKTGEVDRILSAINRVEHLKDVTVNDLRRRATILDNISKYFSLNQNEFAKEGPRTREEIKQAEARIEKMRDEVKQATAKINQKSRNGYTDKEVDLKQLKEKAKAINSASGQLQVLQAIGASISQTNELLIDVKEILRDQNNLIANLQQSDATEKDLREQKVKEENDENEKLSDKWEKEIQEEMGKRKIIRF